MKRYFYLIVLIVLIPVAYVVRQHSRAVLIKKTVQEYIECLVRGDLDSAYILNTDSLAALYNPEILASLQDSIEQEKIIIDKLEERGYHCTLILPDGNSRSIWLQHVDGNWRISGDSDLDKILGSADMLCTSYARDSLIPLLLTDVLLDSASCPVSGKLYVIENGILVCPAGHLGNGIDIYGEECALFCDSLNTIIHSYHEMGYPPATSFADIFENSNGEFGQPGGYHCPNNVYTYYEIIDNGAVCPVHGVGGFSPE
ncbi:MAG: hypothetical protein H8D05_01575 [FCB group bacterium]|nr:hypothetical protein [FCB group bacterium]